ncbi:MAG: translation initiation factor [Bacteroidaceae bacterium]|nr:translation initiation factor [Bacteroidaceae bacterium]
MADWKSALAALGATDEASSKGEEESKKGVERKKRVGVVYSTNPDFSYEDGNEAAPETLPCNQQKLRLSMERAGRGGKTVTLVRGFIGSEDDMAALCKLLKQKCGVGGSVKDGEIIIQGDHRQRLVEILKKEGYTQTK